MTKKSFVKINVLIIVTIFNSLNLFGTDFKSFENTIEPSMSEIIPIENQAGKDNLEIKFVAINGPNISEFTEGKEKVIQLLNKISGFNLILKTKVIEINISPSEMNGGYVFIENKKYYISITATDEMIEGILLNLFDVKKIIFNLTYRPINNASYEVFNFGVQKVEKVLNKFAINKINLDLPLNLNVKISPHDMQGGSIFSNSEGSLSEEIVYVYANATEDKIERFFIKYAKN